MPAELVQPLPRYVQADGTCKVMIILATSFFWTVAGLVLLMLFLGSHSVARLKATGVNTVAVITNTKVSVPPRGGGHVYIASYIFVPQTKTNLSGSYIGQASLSASAFSALAAGDTVVVTYDPHSPSYSKLKSELDVRWAHPYAIFFLAVEAVVPALGFLTAATLLYARRQYLWQRKLVQWGSVASAVITSEREVNSGRVRKARVTYEFCDQDGKLVTGQRSGLPTKKERDAGYIPAYAAVMDNPTVLYDPDDSSRNLLYPPTMVKCLSSGKYGHHGVA